jgi:ATP-dependent 26S proteasome regulatory subunit
MPARRQTSVNSPSSSVGRPPATLSDDQEADRCTDLWFEDPIAAGREMAQLRRDLRQTAAAAEALEGTIQDLLHPKPVLHHVERCFRDAEGRPRAIVNLNGQRRELPVADTVDWSEIENLAPWDMVRVCPNELIVVGTCRDDALHARAHGETATFENYLNRDQGLAAVTRFGRDAEVVLLCPTLRHETLRAGDRLILHRDNPGWAIGVLPGRRSESKFEIPITELTTRLEDLAGLDSVLEQIMQELLPRFVCKDIGERFNLDPFNGMILYSYKAGMGKTALVRALVRYLHDLGLVRGFDVVLYSIQPCALKSMWHGEDARLVRDEVCGPLNERLRRPRSRPLLLVVVFDEVESLGKRAGGGDTQGNYVSSAHNDAVQALLAGMDGLQPLGPQEGPRANVLWVGMTNRPDMLDDALKRPGRMGDLIVQMPDYDAESAAHIMAVYARDATIPWYLGEEIRQGIAEEEIAARILTPSVTRIFHRTVLRYTTEGRGTVDVTAGEILAGVHYKAAMGRAKRRAAVRALRRTGTPAVGFDDVMEGLRQEAHALAGQLHADRQMLARQLQIRIPILRTELVPEHELTQDQYLRAVAS